MRAQYCRTHPDRLAEAECSTCGRPICEECERELGDRLLCPHCYLAAQPTAVLPSEHEVAAFMADVEDTEPEPPPPARRPPRRPAPPPTLNYLWAAVAFLSVLVIGCLVVIVVLFGRVRQVTAEQASVEASVEASAELLQPLAPVGSEPSLPEEYGAGAAQPSAPVEPSAETVNTESVIQPDSGYAVAAARQHFPDQDLRAKVSQHSTDWQTATVLLGPTAAEPQYRVDLEWRGDRYEVLAVHVIQPPEAPAPPTPPAETRRPVQVVGDAAQYNQLPDAEYREVFNDGEKATVEVTYDHTAPKTIEVYLRRAPGRAWRVTGDSLGAAP